MIDGMLSIWAKVKGTAITPFRYLFKFLAIEHRIRDLEEKANNKKPFNWCVKCNQKEMRVGRAGPIYREWECDCGARIGDTYDRDNGRWVHFNP